MLQHAKTRAAEQGRPSLRVAKCWSYRPTDEAAGRAPEQPISDVAEPGEAETVSADEAERCTGRASRNGPDQERPSVGSAERQSGRAPETQSTGDAER